MYLNKEYKSKIREINGMIESNRSNLQPFIQELETIIVRSLSWIESISGLVVEDSAKFHLDTSFDKPFLYNSKESIKVSLPIPALMIIIVLSICTDNKSYTYSKYGPESGVNNAFNDFEGSVKEILNSPEMIESNVDEFIQIIDMIIDKARLTGLSAKEDI